MVAKNEFEPEEKALAETGNCFNAEMGWLLQSGITLEDYKEVGKETEYEYTMFVGNTVKGEYEQMDRPMGNELLARNRFYEYMQKGWFDKKYDTSKAVMKRRIAASFTALREEKVVTPAATRHMRYT